MNPMWHWHANPDPEVSKAERIFCYGFEVVSKYAFTDNGATQQAMKETLPWLQARAKLPWTHTAEYAAGQDAVRASLVLVCTDSLCGHLGKACS